MAKELVMPQMGYDMQQGTVVRWIKKEGDSVSRGEPVAEIETDKAVVEMESIAKGILRKIVVPEGTVTKVGEVIAIIGDADEDITGLESKVSKSVEVSPPPVDEKVIYQESSSGGEGNDLNKKNEKSDVKISPVAKKLAEEMGLDLTKVIGSGPGGRIVRQDIESAIQTEDSSSSQSSSVKSPQSGTVQMELTRMRQAIARITTSSKQQIPHYYVGNEIDMTAAMEMRSQVNKELEGTAKVTVNDLIIKAVAIALKDFPSLNASLVGDYLEIHSHINIGIAIDLEEGLIVPSIPNCEIKSLTDIARASTDLSKRASEGRLNETEYTGGTFSISNLGMLDADSFFAIILPPQSAVLAVGSVKKRPVVDDGEQIIVRQMLNANLSADHRVSDGAEGARFLQTLKALLENPVSLTT